MNPSVPKLTSGLGAVLEEVPKDDDPSSLKFAGSTLVCVAESKEEIVELLKKDIYAQKGVWDVEKVLPASHFIGNSELILDSLGADLARK
jgi:hypothetical protein